MSLCLVQVHIRKQGHVDYPENWEYLTKVRSSDVFVCTSTSATVAFVLHILIPKPVRLYSKHPTIRKVRIHVSMSIGQSYSEICVDLYMYWILSIHYRGKCNFSIDTSISYKPVFLVQHVSSRLRFLTEIRFRGGSSANCGETRLLKSPGSRYRNKRRGNGRG